MGNFMLRLSLHNQQPHSRSVDFSLSFRSSRYHILPLLFAIQLYVYFPAALTAEVLTTLSSLNMIDLMMCMQLAVN